MTALQSSASRMSVSGPPVTAFVRVTGHGNSSFLVGYPGIQATQARIEGKVEIRPLGGISAAVGISYVSIGLFKRESIHPHAAKVIGNHLAAPRKDLVTALGKEQRLFQCAPGRPYENVLAMDLPFMLFIPHDGPPNDRKLRVPPSMSLPSRTAEVYYEVVVSVQQGHAAMNKHHFPIPILRYDKLSTFTMYRTMKTKTEVSDHAVVLETILPCSSFGPGDPVEIMVRLNPNPDWQSKTRKVTIQKIVVTVEERITYNHAGDTSNTRVNRIIRQQESVGMRLPLEGYRRNIRFTYPAKELRDSDGFIPRPHKAFPLLALDGFTTEADLYRIDYFVIVKAHLSGAKDIQSEQEITVIPFDRQSCEAEMNTIEQSAISAATLGNALDNENPMLPARRIVRPGDPNAYHVLGITFQGQTRKLLID